MGEGKEVSETEELTVVYGGHIICQALCSIHSRSFFLAFKLLCNPLSLNVDSYLGLAYNQQNMAKVLDATLVIMFNKTLPC